MKKLVELFIVPEFKKVHLTKDVGLVPYYLAKNYGLEAEIVFTNKVKEDIPNKFRGVKLVELPYKKVNKLLNKLDKFKILENFNFLKYLLKNAHKIDILVLFHFNKKKIPIVLLYKFLNKTGKIYLKMDIEVDTIKSKTQMNFFKKYYGKILVKNIDIFSCETREAYKLILKNGFWQNDLSKKLIYIPNGVDEEEIKKISFEEKENIIITVGRLGTEQKNTEMLLESLRKIELKEWKVLLIGPYSEEFEKKYIEFICENEERRNKVILIGNVEDREKIYEFYRRAKCFILTSNYESFGIVLVEASRFGNYIISTDVGAAKDITKNGEIGEVLNIGDNEALYNEIKKVIEGKINLIDKFEKITKYTEENFIWEKILKNRILKKILIED